MRAFHATNTRAKLRKILQGRKLLPGRNLARPEQPLVHLSLDPFYPGSWALAVICAKAHNCEAYILELEIEDTAPLAPDPTNEGMDYNGRWVVYEGGLPVRIMSVTHIANVQKWEEKKKGYERRIPI